MEIVCRKFNGDALGISTQERGTAAGVWGELRSQPDLMAGAWPSKPHTHHSHWRTGCPRKGLGLSLWWVGSLQQRIIRSPSQPLGLILQTLRELWVWQQSVHSSRSLGQGPTQLSWLHCPIGPPTFDFREL